MKKARTKTWNAPVILWVVLGVCFFGSLLSAIAFFPHDYEWDRIVISSLASPRDNPRGHFIAIAGLALTSLLLIPFELFIKHRLGRFSPRCTRLAGRLFLTAAIFLLLSALVAPGHYRILGVSRSHEHLAQISGVAFCLSLLTYLGVVLSLKRSAAWFRPAALALIGVPVVVLLGSRLALVLAYELSYTQTYRTIRSSLWCSLALWEWIGAVCIYLFLGLVIVGLKEINGNESN